MQLVTKPTFGQSFKNGAIKVFKILRDMDDRTKETFINRFIGCKVRYHAIATTNQLDKIRAVCQMGAETRMASNLRRERTVFKDSLISDWNRLDVAYYVKHLGGGTSGQVDHISQGGVVATIPGGARITGGTRSEL